MVTTAGFDTTLSDQYQPSFSFSLRSLLFGRQSAVSTQVTVFSNEFSIKCPWSWPSWVNPSMAWKWATRWPLHEAFRHHSILDDIHPALLFLSSFRHSVSNLPLNLKTLSWEMWTTFIFFTGASLADGTRKTMDVSGSRSTGGVDKGMYSQLRGSFFFLARSQCSSSFLVHVVSSYPRAPWFNLDRFLTEIFGVVTVFLLHWCGMLLWMGCFRTLIPFSVFLWNFIPLCFLRIIIYWNIIVLIQCSFFFTRFLQISDDKSILMNTNCCYYNAGRTCDIVFLLLYQHLHCLQQQHGCAQPQSQS